MTDPKEKIKNNKFWIKINMKFKNKLNIRKKINVVSINAAKLCEFIILYLFTR